MARGVSNLDLGKMLESLRAEHGETVEIDEVGRVVSRVIRSLRRKYASEGRKLSRELNGLVDFIDSMKDDLASLNPSDIKVDHIAPAADELDAIVKATEGATNSILDAVEEVEAVCQAPKCKDVIKQCDSSAKLEVATTKIYEACTFQDITGQRISKVVSALREIENRVEALSNVLDGGLLGDYDAPEMARKSKTAKKAAITDEDLLNGPQLTASKQDEIDALFDSL